MIKSILIAGGGSAGWITANLLNAELNQRLHLNVAITLLEAPNIPTIGVGEATVPSIRRTLQTIGVREKDFMAACDATFKNLIRFNDWNIGQSFDHPFDRRVRPETDASVVAWLASGQAPMSFAKSYSLLSNLSDRNYAPKAIGWPDYGSTFPYAYHLDATKLALYLTKFGTKRGITHEKGKITSVDVATSGDILSVTTDQQQIFTADMFVDCTGFRARLVGESLGVKQESFKKNLLCDRAATMRIPYDVYQPDRLRPFTTATARASGWTWDINLRERRGIGYVYASDFLDREDAEAELRRFEGDHARDLPVHHIDFITSKRQRSWTGNCVAIGLADGFLEPLESSGLYMIEFAAHSLAELIPVFDVDRATTIDHFNARTKALYAEVLDYVNLHYVTSTRTDTPFWQAATAKAAMTPSVGANLALWQHKPPSDLDFRQSLSLFSLESHEYLLFGMGLKPQTIGIVAATISDLTEPLEKCYRKLPSHEDWLATLGAMPLD